MSIKPLEVKTGNIATYAVTTSKIARSAVTTDKIDNESITGAKLQESIITTGKIKDKAITNDKIADKTISQDKLVLPITPPSAITRPITPAVTNAELADGSVTRAKLAINAVESDNIKDLQVTGGKLASSAVTTPKIADGAVTPAKMSFTPASRPLTPPIATDEIANLSVTYDKIANYSVNDEKLSASAVTRDKIQDASINPPKVDAVNAPSDGQVLSYEGASSRYKYVTPGAGGSKITLINPQTVFDETATSDRSAPLSLATVIPATAVGVLVELHQDGMVPSWAQPSAQIQHPLGGIALTGYITGDAVGTHPHYADNAGIVPVYSPQNIYLVINRVGVSTRVRVTVVGYIE